MRYSLLSGSAALALILGSSAFAGQFYLGPSFLLKYMSASGSSATTLNPRLSIGYFTEYRKYFFAGEITAAPFTVTLASHQDSNALNAKTTSNYGISFIPGIRIRDQWTAFLRLGLVSTRFKGPNTTAVGMMAGVGALFPLNPQWDFRAEYIFTTWRSMYGIGSPKANEIGLGAIYKFDWS